ncbi:neurotactin-like, partial [Anopheles cruzii]|uniref:neurotactin-like n=1 Tax=Anopheles cruzii TaxID=68878 RepID=UPI0022EC95AF
MEAGAKATEAAEEEEKDEMTASIWPGSEESENYCGKGGETEAYGRWVFVNLKLPFAKKPAAAKDMEAGAKAAEAAEEEEKDEMTAEATNKPSSDGGGDAPGENTKKDETDGSQAPKKGLLDKLLVPLASIIPKWFKPVASGEPDDDIELEKTLKDTETKDGVDDIQKAHGTAHPSLSHRRRDVRNGQAK